MSSRVTQVVKEKEELRFEDIKGVEFQIVDSLGQVFDLMNTLEPEEGEGEWDNPAKWEFLVKWE